MILIQEFVKDTWGKDLRVFVVNNKVVGCMMRQSTDDDFRKRSNEEWLSSNHQKKIWCHLLFQNGGYKIVKLIQMENTKN